jgi:hypothetical protein
MIWKLTKHKAPDQDGYRAERDGVHYTIMAGRDKDGPCILSSHGARYIGPLHFDTIAEAKAAAVAAILRALEGGE